MDGSHGGRRIYCLVNCHAFYMIKKFPLKLLHYYVLLSLMVFLSVQGFKLSQWAAPSWVFHHLNDFLLIPMVATWGLHVAWLLKKDRTLRLDVFTIFSLVVLFSLVFEYFLPQQSHRYTADVWDVVCYALGGLVFYFLQKIA